MGFNANAKKHRRILLEYVVGGKIKTTIQLAAAYNYISNNETIDIAQFEKECGVGVVVTTKQMNTTIDAIIAKYKTQLKSKGKGCLGPMYKEIKTTLPWADGKAMSKIFKEK